MELSNIPQILDLLVQNEVITDDQQSVVLKDLEDAKNQGKRLFAGEAVVQRGFCTQEILDEYLIKQTALKSQAAVSDIKNIADNGKQEHPPFLKANWGNNGVNPAQKSPTIAAGVSAAANIAQNIVLLANEKPEIAKDLIKSIEASARLADALLEGKCSTIDKDKLKDLIDDVESGLRLAVNRTDHVAKDINGTPISLKDFIDQRLTEVTEAFALSINKERAAEIVEKMKSSGVSVADGSNKFNPPRKERQIQGR